MSTIRNKPLLIFDGECGFCRLWINRWKAYTKDQVEYASFQEVAGQFPEIPYDQFQRSVHLIESGGEICSGARAVFKTLNYSHSKRWGYRAYRYIPGFAPFAEGVYQVVARNRNLFSKITALLWGKHVEPPTYLLSQWFFLRLLAVIFFIAFLSLGTQIEGLIGRNGILPASTFLDFVQERFGSDGYRLLPTVFWWSSNDVFLQFVCWAGAVLSVFLFLGFAPSFLLFALWVFYLSLVCVCRDFLAFQWDVLLLETSFLAIFLSPPLIWRHALFHQPSRVALWLLRWLLFRLMVSSATAKLLSGDPTWQNFTALSYHYETQPLPTWVGWYAHQLPQWFQEVSVLFMLTIEGIVPFLIVGPRRVRHFAGGLLLLLQVLIPTQEKMDYLAMKK